MIAKLFALVIVVVCAVDVVLELWDRWDTWGYFTHLDSDQRARLRGLIDG